VQTLNFKTLYVLFFIRHQRRQLVHLNVTAHPTVAWVWQQLLNATPDGRQPRHLIHDRDGVNGVDFDARLGGLGIHGIRTAVLAPRANAVAERMVRTFRRECLDHLIVLNEDQLLTILSEFVAFYNRDRPHRSLGLKTPEVRDADIASPSFPKMVWTEPLSSCEVFKSGCRLTEGSRAARLSIAADRDSSGRLSLGPAPCRVKTTSRARLRSLMGISRTTRPTAD
jgi:hypothetical protein